MEAKGTVTTAGRAGATETVHSDVRELRPATGDGSAALEPEPATSKTSRALGDERPPESLTGDLLEPDEEEATPSLGSPRESATGGSHKPPPRPHAHPHPHPHPPERASSLAPPRPSGAPPSSDSEIRITPPLINMGFDGLQMLLETRLREINTELGRVAQASSRGQLVRGALLLLAFAGAGVVIGYLSGSSVEGRTRANIREEVMKTYYAPEVTPAKRKDILGFVQGQLAKSDVGLRLWVDSELRKVDLELKNSEAENAELKALRQELEEKESELRAAQVLLDKAESKAKAQKANRLAALAVARTKSVTSEGDAVAPAEEAPAPAEAPSSDEEE